MKKIQWIAKGFSALSKVGKYMKIFQVVTVGIEAMRVEAVKLDLIDNEETEQKK